MSNRIRLSYVAAASLMVLVPIALFATQSSPTAAPADSAVKIAVIDTQKIVVSSAMGKNLSRSLEQFQHQAEDEGRRRQAEIRDLQARISSSQQSLPADQLAQLKKQLEEKMTAFRRWQDDATREGKKKQETMLSDIEGKVMPLISQIAKEMGYTAVFRKHESGLLYVDEAMDITALVIQRLDAAR